MKAATLAILSAASGSAQAGGRAAAFSDNSAIFSCGGDELGGLSAAQIERVAARLRSARPEQLRVVVVHQPLYVEGEAEARHLLRGCDAALTRWAEAGADVVLGGHIHLPYVAELTPPGADGARIVIAQAGTALSTRLRRGVPNSVNVIRHEAADATRCAIERWDFSAARGEFQRIDARTFELQRHEAAQVPCS